MYSACARTWNYSTRYFPRESRRDLKDIEYPAFCQERKKRKKETKMRKMADEMQIYSLHGKVNGAKVCRRSVSVSDRWSHTYIYTHKDGIQGGGELPGRDLRLGHTTFPSDPDSSSLPLLPPSIPPTFVSLIDATRARVTRNICGSTIDHAWPHRHLDYDSRELDACREYKNTFKQNARYAVLYIANYLRWKDSNRNFNVASHGHKSR